MTRLRVTYIALALLMLALATMTAVVYKDLPQTVPTHWNYKGEVDGHGPRATVWLMPGISVFIALLFLGISFGITKVDKERFSIMCMGLSVMAFFVVLQALILMSSMGRQPDFLRWMGSAMCLMFMGLGRGMRDLPRNGLAGIRTPWTMASDEAWRVSHQRAAKIVVWSSAVGLLLSIAASGFAGMIVSFLGMMYTLVDSYRVTRPSRMYPAG